MSSTTPPSSTPSVSRQLCKRPIAVSSTKRIRGSANEHPQSREKSSAEKAKTFSSSNGSRQEIRLSCELILGPSGPKLKLASKLMAQRRKRRTKAEIEADKLAQAEAAAEEARMEAEGYEKKRARDDHGHFIKDDPETPENEAWEWVKKEDPVVEPEPIDEVVQKLFDEALESKEERIVSLQEPTEESTSQNPKFDPHFGIKQARFGGGRQKWKRRTRGEIEF